MKSGSTIYILDNIVLTDTRGRQSEASRLRMKPCVWCGAVDEANVSAPENYFYCVSCIYAISAKRP